MKKISKVTAVIILTMAIFALPLRSEAHPVPVWVFHHMHHVVLISGKAVEWKAVPISFEALWGAIALACIWHIPAWEKAKANHTEATYQAQEMWPQQLFDKLPGGTPGRLNVGAAPAA
jgi:hypothetical protein